MPCLSGWTIRSAQAVPQDREPEIWLRVTREEGRGGRKVVFTVEDNGTGIREEERRAVWDKGVSGRNSSGLGLAFVSGVVENMEGEIRVSSVPGEGTSISLVIPEGGKKQ